MKKTFSTEKDERISIRNSIISIHGIISTILFGIFLIPTISAQYYKHPDLQGDYCAAKRDPCCDGRYDDCSVPILGTLCYCDEFCNRTVNPDCCPDYWEACLGMKPLPTRRCNKDGRYYNAGEKVKINCNLCTCGNDGQMKCEYDPCMIEENLIREINSNQQRGWYAANYSDFWGRKTREGFMFKTGTIMPDQRVMNVYPVRLFYDQSILPRSFDARANWPGLVKGAKDQGWCGASWAFSTLGVYADRLAIESNGKENDVLSTQNLLNCNIKGQRGCNGGQLGRAWSFIRKRGIVNEECLPYVSGTTQKIESCTIPVRANKNNIPCRNNAIMQNRGELYRAEPAYRISSNEYDIMYEIFSNGPVQALMKVYEDFFLYKSGIYSYSGLGTGKSSTHSVRIVGWGEERFEKYWIAANSWGQDWGESGFFRIRRGTNESDIEQFVLTVRAILDKDRRLTSRNNRNDPYRSRNRS